MRTPSAITTAGGISRRLPRVCELTFFPLTVLVYHQLLIKRVRPYGLDNKVERLHGVSVFFFFSFFFFLTQTCQLARRHLSCHCKSTVPLGKLRVLKRNNIKCKFVFRDNRWSLTVTKYFSPTRYDKLAFLLAERILLMLEISVMKPVTQASKTTKHPQKV